MRSKFDSLLLQTTNKVLSIMKVWGYKMGYAIVGYFDKTSDEKIRALWKALAEIGVDDYLINSENNPHIKFAMFNSINLLQSTK